MRADDYIEKLHLEAHPEGGRFTESYHCQENIPDNALPARFNGERSFSTAIYYLLKYGEKSTLHRIKSDEIWHFYDGDPLSITVFYEGRGYINRLGTDLTEGHLPQIVVPAGAVFGAFHETKGRHGFTLAGCTVSPGFDFNDFEKIPATELESEYLDNYSNLVNSFRGKL